MSYCGTGPPRFGFSGEGSKKNLKDRGTRNDCETRWEEFADRREGRRGTKTKRASDGCLSRGPRANSRKIPEGDEMGTKGAKGFYYYPGCLRCVSSAANRRGGTQQKRGGRRLVILGSEKDARNGRPGVIRNLKGTKRSFSQRSQKKTITIQPGGLRIKNTGGAD